MGEKTTREQIVEAADQLFYRQGFEHTSFADIARTVNISRGNFYHHFKSKDEILDATIARRLAETRKMLDGWELAGASPADRIGSFIDILIANRRQIQRYGCPVGTLCTELAKLSHPARGEANELFSLFRVWLRRQFTLLGRKDADQLALHVLARSQGVATLAAALREDTFLDEEVRQLHAWLQQVCSGTAASKPARRKRPHVPPAK